VKYAGSSAAADLATLLPCILDKQAFLAQSIPKPGPPMSQSSTFQNWRTLCPLRKRVGKKVVKVPVYPANLLKTN